MEKNGLGNRYSMTDDEYIRMQKSEDSNLAWMTMFYALPRELMAKQTA